MNIFVLDRNFQKCAEYHCDKHIVKQILESFQMLGSAVIRHGATVDMMPLTKSGTPLKGGYHNHPCTIWTGDSRENYKWLCNMAIAMCVEYTVRYGKIHSCEKGIRHLYNMADIIPSGDMTEFAIAISDDKICRKEVECFSELDAVQQYRFYYIYDKPFAKWKLGNIPKWFKK